MQTIIQFSTSTNQTKKLKMCSGKYCKWVRIATQILKQQIRFSVELIWKIFHFYLKFIWCIVARNWMKFSNFRGKPAAAAPSSSSPKVIAFANSCSIYGQYENSCIPKSLPPGSLACSEFFFLLWVILTLVRIREMGWWTKSYRCRKQRKD